MFHVSPTVNVYSLLVLIANECYKTGQYLYAAKAFDVLERIDDCTDYWDAKRGACIGVFQNIIVGKEPNEHLGEVVGILRNSNHPQVTLNPFEDTRYRTLCSLTVNLDEVLISSCCCKRLEKLYEGALKVERKLRGR